MDKAEISVVLDNEKLGELIYAKSDAAEPLFYAKESFKDEGERIKYIKKVESIIRGSSEYKELIRYIRQDLQINSCSILTAITSEGASIELHHAPLTLFDITEAILNRRLENGIFFSSLNLAEEVIITHFEGIVGLTPLSATMHELVHNGVMYVKASEIVGNYDAFIKRFEGYLSEAAVEKLVRFKNYQEEDRQERLPLLTDAKKEVESSERIEQLNSVLGKEKLLKGDADAPYLLQ